MSCSIVLSTLDVYTSQTTTCWFRTVCCILFLQDVACSLLFIHPKLGVCQRKRVTAILRTVYDITDYILFMETAHHSGASLLFSHFQTIQTFLHSSPNSRSSAPLCFRSLLLNCTEYNMLGKTNVLFEQCNSLNG